MADDFEGYQPGLDSPASRIFAITPDDATDLPHVTRGLHFNTGGAAVVVDKHGNQTSFVGAGGVTYPLRVVRVLATGTGATVVGLA